MPAGSDDGNKSVVGGQALCRSRHHRPTALLLGVAHAATADRFIKFCLFIFIFFENQIAL